MRKLLTIIGCIGLVILFTAAIGDQFSVDNFRIDSSGNVIQTGKDYTTSGNVDVNGSLLLDVMYISYNSTLTVTQSGLVISTGTAAFAIGLPTAVGNTGLTYTVKLDSGPVPVYAITITPLGAETIDGETTNAQIDAWYDFITITSDGDEWLVTGIDTGM